MIEVNYSPEERLRQGDIISNIDYIQKLEEIIEGPEGNLEITIIDFPLVIILTQDCDLDRDFKNRHSTESILDDDKKLISALVAPVYNSEQFFEGSHLEYIGRKMQRINSKRRQILKKNETPRYHYLEFPPESSIANSVIDFKHYFSMNIEHLEQIKKDHFECQVKELYREDISHRFVSYLSRIGLPEISCSPSR